MVGTSNRKKYNHGCKSVIKDKQELYLHPQQFSGAVLEDNIQHIEQLLSQCEMFKFEHTDIYEEVFDLTDEEYIDLLRSRQNEIEFDILKTLSNKEK